MVLRTCCGRGSECPSESGPTLPGLERDRTGLASGMFRQHIPYTDSKQPPVRLDEGPVAFNPRLGHSVLWASKESCEPEGSQARGPKALSPEPCPVCDVVQALQETPRASWQSDPSDCSGFLGSRWLGTGIGPRPANVYQNLAVPPPADQPSPSRHHPGPGGSPKRRHIEERRILRL